mmetsp:Transcript_49679/g.153478  ORF Transcript_49679/g.153478 Transcript_49679/m.153478 type:complete len:518 (+) Transcript_49679:670-2223(+)
MWAVVDQRILPREFISKAAKKKRDNRKKVVNWAAGFAKLRLSAPDGDDRHRRDTEGNAEIQAEAPERRQRRVRFVVRALLVVRRRVVDARVVVGAVCGVVVLVDAALGLSHEGLRQHGHHVGEGDDEQHTAADRHEDALRRLVRGAVGLLDADADRDADRARETKDDAEHGRVRRRQQARLGERGADRDAVGELVEGGGDEEDADVAVAGEEADSEAEDDGVDAQADVDDVRRHRLLARALQRLLLLLLRRLAVLVDGDRKGVARLLLHSIGAFLRADSLEILLARGRRRAERGILGRHLLVGLARLARLLRLLAAAADDGVELPLDREEDEAGGERDHEGVRERVVVRFLLLRAVAVVVMARAAAGGARAAVVMVVVVVVGRRGGGVIVVVMVVVIVVVRGCSRVIVIVVVVRRRRRRCGSLPTRMGRRRVVVIVIMRSRRGGVVVVVVIVGRRCGSDRGRVAGRRHGGGATCGGGRRAVGVVAVSVVAATPLLGEHLARLGQEVQQRRAENDADA